MKDRPNWWEWQAKKQGKAKRITVAIEQNPDPWAKVPPERGIRVQEHDLSDTGVIRFLTEVRKKWGRK